ncbi:MAG: hypothetical protein JOZ98_18710 [Solirubrobacterales bacterium]|nr:hypothetical protein [Solirubrobacterales bacterium]
MSEHEASRTLVKSPPELWTECSDPSALARHLSGSFGEIKITRLEPETAVAWEGERASGTVRIEPSGWGTRVTLTAQTAPPQPAEPEAAPAPAPAMDMPWPGVPGALATRRTLRERLRALFRPATAIPPPLVPDPEPEPPIPEPVTPEPEPADAELDAGAALAGALDSLGQAHHRPYSRA